MLKRLMFITILCICGLTASAQPQNYNAVMGQAKVYFNQKEYLKSNDCYEQVCDELKGTDYESLIPTVRNFIAINNMYMGVAALKKKDYPTAKTYLEESIKDAKPASKVYYMSHSWIGQWNSEQSQNIHAKRGNLETALEFSLEAERYFELAQDSEKRLNAQLGRASILQDLTRNDEAETLLKHIISECEGFKNRSLIMGRAAYGLGELEMIEERFQLAMQHLEQSYDLCNAETSKDAKTWACLAANKLNTLYTRFVPDNDMANLWKQRYEELKSNISKDEK